MNDRIGTMIEVVASHSAWLDLANTPAQWQMTEAQVRTIVAGLSTAAPALHWTTAELAPFFADVPRQHVGQSFDAALVMGTLQWSLTPGAPTWLSPCMVGAVRLTPSPAGGWICTLLGAVAPNRALRRAVLAAAQVQRLVATIAGATAPDVGTASVTTLGDLFGSDDPDGTFEVAGRFLPTVLLCQLGPAVDALLTELLTSPGPARALTRTQQFTLRGTAPDLLFPLDADLAQRDVVAAIVRCESLCVDAMVGAGTTQTPHSYRFTDAGVAQFGAATLYYRLRQLDYDGSTTFSNIISIVPGQTTGSEPVIYPNMLTGDDFTLRCFAVGAETAELVITDATGRLAHRSQVALASGYNYIASRDLPGYVGLAPGIYAAHLALPARRPVHLRLLRR